MKKKVTDALEISNNIINNISCPEFGKSGTDVDANRIGYDPLSIECRGCRLQSACLNSVNDKIREKIKVTAYYSAKIFEQFNEAALDRPLNSRAKWIKDNIDAYIPGCDKRLQEVFIKRLCTE